MQDSEKAFPGERQRLGIINHVAVHRLQVHGLNWVREGGNNNGCHRRKVQNTGYVYWKAYLCWGFVDRFLYDLLLLL